MAGSSQVSVAGDRKPDFRSGENGNCGPGASARETRILEWFQSNDGRCNFEQLSLFTLKFAKTGAIVGVVFPAPDQRWGWAAIGGWSGFCWSPKKAREAVEALEIIKRLRS